MKAIGLRKGSTAAELVELPKPKLKPGEVLDKTIRCGVCRTDQEILRRGQA